MKLPPDMNDVEPPNTLWHYTSVRAFVDILRSGELHATSIEHLNDGSELSYAAEVVERMAPSRRVPSELSLGRWLQGVLNTRKTTVAEDLFYDGVVCVFCLSEERDDLSQWRAYGALSGIAIGFETTGLRSLAEAAGFRLQRCRYDFKDQAGVLNPYIDVLIEASQTGALDGTARPRFFTVAPLIKHPAFASEKEWRLVSWLRGVQTLDLRADEARVAPFAKIPMFSKEWLEANPSPLARLSGELLAAWTASIGEVIIGPSVYADLTMQTLVHALHHARIRVTKSLIPYRSL